MQFSSQNSNNTSLKSLVPERRWLRLEHLIDVWAFVENHSDFQLASIGHSEEGRDLKVIRWGKGPKRIFAWTQMHGNEPTATLACAELLQDLVSDPELKALDSKIEVALILMLNPDGAERFQRRNALGIDLNRDAVARCSAEIKAYFNFLESFKPQWAINLHDQRNIFSAGATEHCATLSFLAPSADEERSIRLERKVSMQMIAAIHQKLEGSLSGHFGRYSDEFYPRALGDNLMKMGIPNILFEAGHFPGDRFRRKARELNRRGLKEALHLVATDGWELVDPALYHLIPENKSHLRDLIFRDLQFGNCRLDLALMEQEIANKESGELEIKYRIDDIGDLSHLHGIQEYKGGILAFEGDFNQDALANGRIQSEREFVFNHGYLQEH